ncbi:protein L-Myc-1a [Antennarius striatus]|uniref:protein L-Myc-1a n=1 Tax=Antennarius striatus TaxID=241820 RepID=UPI0035B09E16
MDCYYPHYFFNNFDTEEDFYQSTAPSEDIWKKFELLPSPPLSPTRTLSGGAPPLSPGDKLSRLSRVLGQDEDYDTQFIPHPPKLFGNLSSIIIRDCMWSSFSASKQLEKVNGRVSAAAQAAVSAARPTKAQCVAPVAPLATPATDCVDPAAVLTIPANSCRKPASSGSESRSDSSDEEDDEEDEEEEIDVVTVESKQSRMRLVNLRKPVTVTVRADPCPKRFHASVHRQQHNYAAPSPDSEPDPEEEDEEDEEEQEPPVKRVSTGSSRHARASQSASPSETPQTSDTEDTDRRKNHNFLERKRRNDLRSRFLALRDQIPGLESSKTPKVAILTQATEYLMELSAKEKRQLQEKKRLKVRQQQLHRRLSELKHL